MHYTSFMCSVDASYHLVADSNFLDVSEGHNFFVVVEVWLTEFGDNTEFFAVEADYDLKRGREGEDVTMADFVERLDFALNVVDKFGAEGFFSEILDGDFLAFIDGAVYLSLSSWTDKGLLDKYVVEFGFGDFGEKVALDLWLG